MFISREELAWVAGFFDGEGCFTLRKQNGRYYAQASTTQTDREVLDKCVRIAGLGNVTGPTKPSRTRVYQGFHCKPRYSWQVCGLEKTQALVAMLWQWLGSRKREQAMRMLQLHGQVC